MGVAPATARKAKRYIAGLGRFYGGFAPGSLISPARIMALMSREMSKSLSVIDWNRSQVSPSGLFFTMSIRWLLAASMFNRAS